MRWLVFLVLLGLIGGGFAVEKCVACELLSGQPAPRLNSYIEGNNLIVQAFYDNSSQTPSRQPLSNTIIIVEVSSPSKVLDVYKIYTDKTGTATLDFSSLNKTCLSFKILYCPFCNPNTQACGFESCLQYSRIATNATSASQLTTGPGTTPIRDSDLNPNLYQPNIISTNFCPPPPPLSSTPAICLPALLIFALLGGALHLSGHNPLAAFNLGSPRIGKHLRSAPRGRSVSMNLMSVVQAASSIASAAKTIGEKGMSGLAKQELAQAKGRMDAMNIGKTVKSGLHELKRSKAAKTKSGSAKTVATTNVVATPQGSAFNFGTSGPGFASLVKGRSLGEMLKGEGLLKVLGSFALDVFQNTIPGRTIGFLYQLSTGRSLFETAFMKPLTKITELAMANAELTKEGKPTVIIGNEIYALVAKKDANGQDVFVITDDKGNKTVSIQIDSPDGKTKTDLTVTVDKSGQVSLIKTQVAGIGEVYIAKQSDGSLTYFKLPQYVEGESKAPIIITDQKELQTLQGALDKLPINFKSDGKTIVENAELRVEAVDLNKSQIMQEAQREAKILSKAAEEHIGKDTKALYADLNTKESEDALRRIGVDPTKVKDDAHLVSALNDALSGTTSRDFTAQVLSSSGVSDATSEKPDKKTTDAIILVNSIVANLTVAELSNLTPDMLREKVGLRAGVNIDFTVAAAELSAQGKKLQQSYAGQDQVVQAALNSSTVGGLAPVRDAIFARDNPLVLLGRHEGTIPSDQLSKVQGFILGNKLLDLALRETATMDEAKTGQVLTRVSELFGMLEAAKVGAVKKERLDETLGTVATYVAAQELTPSTSLFDPRQTNGYSDYLRSTYEQRIKLARDALQSGKAEEYERAVSSLKSLEAEATSYGLESTATTIKTVTRTLEITQSSLGLLGGTAPTVGINDALTSIGDKALNDAYAKGDVAAAQKRLEILLASGQSQAEVASALYYLNRETANRALSEVPKPEQFATNAMTVLSYGSSLGAITQFDRAQNEEKIRQNKADIAEFRKSVAYMEDSSDKPYTNPSYFSLQQRIAALEQETRRLELAPREALAQAEKLRKEFETMARYNVDGAADVSKYLAQCQAAILSGKDAKNIEPPPGSFKSFAEQQATLVSRFGEDSKRGFEDLDRALQRDAKDASKLAEEAKAEQAKFKKDEKPPKTDKA